MYLSWDVGGGIVPIELDGVTEDADVVPIEIDEVSRVLNDTEVKPDVLDESNVMSVDDVAVPIEFPVVVEGRGVTVE